MLRLGEKGIATTPIAGDDARRYAVRLVGPFGLWSASGESVLPRSRRARALLAYLMLTAPHAAPRDALAGLLWSERGDEQARASLRQTLFELHPLAGADRLLVVTRTAVSLNIGAVSTDLARFEHAVETGDWPMLVTAFDEPDATLLRDMRDLSPMFDEWLAQRRSQWHQARRASALRMCQGDAADRAPVQALALAQRVAMIDPLDEAATVAVMERAHAVGDIAVVRRTFASLSQALRRELGVAPSRATVAAHDRLTSGSQGPPAIVLEPVSPDASGLIVTQAPAKRRALIAAALAIAGVAGLAITLKTLVPAAVATDDSLVTIQPLTVKPGDLKAEEISQGLQSAVVRHLTGTDTPVQVVDEVRAGQTGALAIRGNSFEDRGVLRANIKLVANPSGKVVWAGSFVRQASELDQFEEQISIQIARELHCAYADGRQPFFDRDPELARLSLSHCDTLGRDMDEAIHYDWQITRRAPSFARGWAEYAMDTALVASEMPPLVKAAGYARADDYARHALALDPHQGLAHAALVVASEGRPWPERFALVKEGLAADPTSPELHLRHSFMLTRLGRQQDALGETIAAYHYDHLLPGKLISRALAEVASGHIDEARDDLALSRTYWPELHNLDQIVLALGVAGVQPGDALQLAKARVESGVKPGDAALAAFLAWRVAPSRQNALAAAKQIVDAAARDQGRGGEIRLLALLGRHDDAYRVGDRLATIVVDPGWFAPELAGFRRDPRFMRMMRRTDIAAAWQQTGLWPDFCSELGGAAVCRDALRSSGPVPARHRRTA